jgi:hypothetical protein
MRRGEGELTRAREDLPPERLRLNPCSGEGGQGEEEGAD